MNKEKLKQALEQAMKDLAQEVINELAIDPSRITDMCKLLTDLARYWQGYAHCKEEHEKRGYNTKASMEAIRDDVIQRAISIAIITLHLE